ncbi:alpha/beta hydrolase [Fulvivirgaceae bacterium BMA12]|uniref:Alpha/beta hydrolase n=1 Tax=Agaribacillus aureus TaxID=3051825 RepID=A0ABT8LA53_9BACT|nr:alpha/beta hydrolase [Fulvivirgaceae bacterium BMA12]
MKAISTIAALLFLLGACTQKNKTQETMEAPRLEVKNGAMPINYNQCGDGDVALLFVHGWGINQSYWDGQVDYFCKNYTVVTMDVPGFGQTAKTRDQWTIENYGQDVGAVIDQLGLDQVILVGHSMGGDIVLEAALNNPEKVIGIIGIDNFKSPAFEKSEEMENFLSDFVQSLRENYREVVGDFGRKYLFHPNTDSLIIERVVGDFQNSDPDVAIGSIESLFNYPEASKLQKLDIKLHLINCVFTPIMEENLQATGVAYEIVNMEETGHYPMLEKPDEFNQQLAATIQKILAGRAHP